MTEWKPIDTLEQACIDDDDLSSETILLWNPCDGLHAEWLMARFPHQLVRDGYTHWQRQGPPPPEDEVKRIAAEWDRTYGGKS